MSALAFTIRYLEEVVWNYDLARNRACFRVVLATLDSIQSGARQPIPGHWSFMEAAVRAAVHDELEAADVTDEMNLLMPFVVCKSQGGPYDDDAFVAGWRLAEIRAALSHSGSHWVGYIPEAVLPQVDLIAMERGLVAYREGVDPAGVVEVHIELPRVEPDESWRGRV